MSKTELVKTKTADLPELSCEFTVPETLDEANSLWGDEVVLNKAIAQVRINFQAAVREKMTPDKEGNAKSEAEIKKEMAEWVPGVRAPAKSTVEKADDLFSKMTPEEKQDAFARLKALQKAEKAA